MASTRVQGWGDEALKGVRCGTGGGVWGGGSLSERRATKIGLLCPKVCIGGIFALTSPNQNIEGNVSPASPAGLTPVVISFF